MVAAVGGLSVWVCFSHSFNMKQFLVRLLPLRSSEVQPGSQTSRKQRLGAGSLRVRRYLQDRAALCVTVLY